MLKLKLIKGQFKVRFLSNLVKNSPVFPASFRASYRFSHCIYYHVLLTRPAPFHSMVNYSDDLSSEYCSIAPSSAN